MTLALYGKTRRRQGGLILAGLLAVFAAVLMAVTLTPSDVAKADTATLAVSSASCTDPLIAGIFQATDNDPAACSGANAAALAAGGATVNLEADDIPSGIGNADVGFDDLSVSFNVTSIPDGSTVTAAAVKVYATQSDAAGVLRVGSAAGGSQYGALALGVPQSYTNAALVTAVGSALAGNTLTIFLSMDCNPNSEDCGALVDQVALDVTWTPPVAPADADGDGVPDATDQCPNTPPATPVNAVGCSLAQTVPPATVQGPNLVGQCTGLDIHLVVDNSGSIGAGNMTTLISQLNAAGTGFIAKVELGSPSTTWRVTKFQGTNVTSSSVWGNDLASVTAFIAGMNSSGGTPTAAGINQAIAGGLNTAQQNLMIIITDGAPNVTLAGDTGNFTGGAADAIARADAARAAGWTTMVVPIGPGDGSAPGGGNGPWSQAVNQSLAGIPGISPNGVVFPAGSFDTLADTLLAAIGQGCQRSVIVGKVYDPTLGAPQDATLFAGSVSNPATPWSGVGFGQFSLPIANLTPTVAHTVAETAPNNGWNPTGFILGSFNAQGLPQCPAYNAVGWLANGTDIVPALPANTTAQAVVCIKNTKIPDTRTIRVAKVSGTATHPSANFSGGISPGQVSPADAAWTSSLALDAINGSAETFTTATTPQTVTESAPPTGWTFGGFSEQVDDGGAVGAECPAPSSAANYTDDGIVPAGIGNVIVCVRNTYTAPTRTVRIQKVTTSAGHPGGAFAGTISPGGTNFDTTWNATLAAAATNSAPGETFTTLQTAQDVVELVLPANWTNAGYFFVVDAGQQCSGTEPYTNVGGSAVVPANASNYLVCVLNTYTAPTRTVRIIKTSNTAVHPGGSFSGTILPGQTAPADTTWDATLAADAASAPAGTFQTEQTEQTVNEIFGPDGWFENGYAVIADPTGAATCAGATYASTASATVPADAANYLVCVRNLFVPPLPTVSKVAGPDQQPGTPLMQAYDATYAYYQIVINNSGPNSIERDNIVITDSFSQAELTSTTGSGTCGGPLPLAGPWTCNDVAAGATLTLNIRIPLSANPDGGTICGGIPFDNVLTSATISGVPLAIINGGPGDPERVSVPPTASADCITITKVNTGNGTWTIGFLNTGPAVTVNMMDTYAPFVDGTDNINSVTYQAGGAAVPGCTGFQLNQVLNCAPVLAGGTPGAPALTSILVTTDQVSIQCGADEVINTVSFTYNGSAPETADDNFPFSGTDCAVPTVSKTAAAVAFDGTYAYFQVVVDNDFPNAAPQNDIVVTDTLPLAELTSFSGSGSCTPGTGVGPWECDGIAAGGTLTLNIRVPITVAGTDTCPDRTITNNVTAVQATLGDLPTTSVPAVVIVPGTASAGCLSLTKTNTGNGAWRIEIHNTGPATTVSLSDTYAPFQDDVIESVAVCTSALVIAVDELSFTCSVSVPASNGTAAPEAIITVTTTALPVGTCEGGGSSNTVTGFFGSPTGPTIGTDADTQTVPVAPGACTVTLNLCKQWTTEPGEQVVGGNEDFMFTVGTTEVTIEGVAEGGATECVTLTVTVDEFGQTGLPITENGTVSSGGNLSGFVTPLLSINGVSQGASQSVDLPLDECQAPASLVGQILGLVRSISFLVVEEPPPPSTTPDCTVLFVNDDTENNLPTGNIQVEKYLDINGDGDANDAGEGPIPGWQMTTTCPNDPTNVTDTNGSGVVFIPGLNEAQSCTVTEELPANWQVTRVTVNGANMGASTSASVTVPGSGATAYVRFYNREVGGISVHKTTVNVLNGIETVNTNDDDGWTVTVKSAACSIDQAKDTDANGNAVFSGLPMCTDYVVAEVPSSGEPGYTPAGPISVSPITPTVGGTTQVNFTNETHDFTPPCPNCSGATPTPTPPTPSPTPPTATATPGTPTATPGTPTVPTATPTTGGGSNPTPVSTIAGNRTPGPGQTPVAPSTGDGDSSGGSGPNLLLILAGLGALAGGITFVAFGRKSRS